FSGDGVEWRFAAAAGVAGEPEGAPGMRDPDRAPHDAGVGPAHATGRSGVRAALGAGGSGESGPLQRVSGAHAASDRGGGAHPGQVSTTGSAEVDGQYWRSLSRSAPEPALRPRFDTAAPRGGRLAICTTDATRIRIMTTMAAVSTQAP